MKKRQCILCGVIFSSSPSHKRKYCSRLCSDKSKINKPGFWLGKHRSEETKKKISKSKAGQRPWMKGRKHTFISNEKNRISHLGKKASQTTKDKMSMNNSKYWLGKKRPKASVATRQKQSESLRGSRGGNWQGGRTASNFLIRHSLEYKLWRESVFKRDNYTCQLCGQRGRTLNADHIKPFAFFIELRFDINNGRTLCVECHKKTDSYMNSHMKKEDYVYAK